LWSQVVAVASGLPANVVAVGRPDSKQRPRYRAAELRFVGAPRGIRTPNRQIRRLVLYVHAVSLSAICAAQVRCQIQPDRQSPV
jgi:hypothetical protein